MSIADSILNILKKKVETVAETPEGLCPNCWGREEYAGKFYAAVQAPHSDDSDSGPQVGWVQEYANKHLAGIELKSEEGELVCKMCTTRYKLAEE